MRWYRGWEIYNSWRPDWRAEILRQSAEIGAQEDEKEAAGPKAVRPKNWRLKRGRRQKITRASRATNRKPTQTTRRKK